MVCSELAHPTFHHCCSKGPPSCFVSILYLLCNRTFVFPVSFNYMFSLFSSIIQSITFYSGRQVRPSKFPLAQDIRQTTKYYLENIYNWNVLDSFFNVEGPYSRQNVPIYYCCKNNCFFLKRPNLDHVLKLEI